MLRYKKTPLGRSGVGLNFQAPYSGCFSKNLLYDLIRISKINEDPLDDFK